MCSDFERDDETGQAKVNDAEKVIAGGIISGIKVKMTRNGKSMAYFDLDDLGGHVEVVVFPRPYMDYRKISQRITKCLSAER